MPRRRKRIDRSWVDKLPPKEQRDLMYQAMEAPSVDGLPDAIEYGDRTSAEFVISGPLGDCPGTGRRFPDLATALLWAESHYPRARLVHDREDAPRWAILVKPRV